jgi:hypothetical protein
MIRIPNALSPGGTRSSTLSEINAGEGFDGAVGSHWRSSRAQRTWVSMIPMPRGFEQQVNSGIDLSGINGAEDVDGTAGGRRER